MALPKQTGWRAGGQGEARYSDSSQTGWVDEVIDGPGVHARESWVGWHCDVMLHAASSLSCLSFYRENATLVRR
jgi:hypothetical protein